jgi:hypothetical protein
MIICRPALWVFKIVLEIFLKQIAFYVPRSSYGSRDRLEFTYLYINMDCCCCDWYRMIGQLRPITGNRARSFYSWKKRQIEVFLFFSALSKLINARPPNNNNIVPISKTNLIDLEITVDHVFIPDDYCSLMVTASDV